MALPIIGAAMVAKAVLGATVLAGGTGVVKGIEGACNNSNAKDLQEKAKFTQEIALKNIEKQKNDTRYSIEELGRTKVNILANEIESFINSFQKIKNIELTDSEGIDELRKLMFTKNELIEMREMSVAAIDFLSGTATGVGTGALIGWGAYTGTTAIGFASTGAAISGLSGVAATNATLAWLGGGSIAAGGGGMALGTTVLGGLVAGPALLVAGGLYAKKAESNLDNARSNLAQVQQYVEELKIAEEQLRLISICANDLEFFMSEFAEDFNENIEEMEDIVNENTNWNSYSKYEKEKIAITVKEAKFLKALIDKPLLTDDGILTNEIKRVVSKLETTSREDLIEIIN